MITQKLAELDPNELPFIDKEVVEIRVILKAIKAKIEIFNEIEVNLGPKKEESYPFLYGASFQTLRIIESIINKELSNIESKD